MTALACYRIRDHIGGKPVTDYDQAVDLKRWGERITDAFETTEPVPAKLYVVAGANRPPDWLALLRDGFGEEVRVDRAPAPGALLLVRQARRRRTHYLAFAFGIGRYLLRDDAYARNFGLRVALNAVFEGDEGREDFDPLRLRNVIARRVAANTMRFQGQASQRAALEEFDVDLERDLLHGVTGEPVDTKFWGSRISGSDAAHLNVPIRFAALPRLCGRLLDGHIKTDYQARFSWIDDVSRLQDPDRIEQLESLVVELLRSQNIDAVSLTVPELVEWHRIHRFRLPYERRPEVRRPELRLADYLTVLHREQRLEGLSVGHLRSQRIDALDGDGNLAYSWTVWRCMSGEIEYEGRIYVLDDGDFFEVSRDYLDGLHRFLTSAVPPSSLTLPAADALWDEAAYNERAAASDGLLLLDRRTVKVDRSTTAVEVCDILSSDRHLVHVKRKLGSSLLSHLFAQGLVSADLLLTNEAFRRGARDRIAEAVSADPKTVELEDFEFFDEAALDPTRFEIVYAIVADWRGDDLVARLPFFSKVNLRRCVEELRRRRFSVTHLRIPTTTGGGH